MASIAKKHLPKGRRAGIVAGPERRPSLSLPPKRGARRVGLEICAAEGSKGSCRLCGKHNRASG